MHRLAEEYSDVSYEDVLVDNCAMQLVRDPGQFDVVVTENMFGDILSDEASMVTGSIGLLPSASIGDTAPGLYEPIHGSAPDIAGQDKANPIATILSVAMMFRYSFHLAAEAQAIEDAVDAVLAEGWRTADIAPPHRGDERHPSKTKPPQNPTPPGGGGVGPLLCRRRGGEGGGGGFGKKKKGGGIPPAAHRPPLIDSRFMKKNKNHLQSCKSAQIIYHA